MASDINSVILVGRLTRDAELKYTSSGTPVCKFAIAVNRKKRSGEQWSDEASFFDIVLWGRFGETMSQYLQKGKQVAVQGELRQNRWEQDGQSRSKVEIVASTMQLLGGNGGGSGSGSFGGSGSQSSPRPSGQNSQPFERYNDQSGSGPEDFEDDIPF